MRDAQGLACPPTIDRSPLPGVWKSLWVDLQNITGSIVTAQGLARPPTIDLFALAWGVEKSVDRFAKHYEVNSHDALIEQPPGLSGAP